jgi:quercetin dioxygenase-like cupin family protein
MSEESRRQDTPAAAPASTRTTESGISILRVEDGHLFTGMGSTMRFVVWPGVGLDTVTMHQLTMAPGDEFANHVHEESVDIISVVQGSGVLISDGVEYRIQQGDVVYVPAGVDHGMRNDGEETLISVDSQAPPDPAIYRR